MPVDAVCAVVIPTPRLIRLGSSGSRKMPSRTNRLISTVAVVTLLLIPAWESQAADDARLLDQLTSQEDWESAAKLARNLTADTTPDEDLTFALARLARGLQTSGQTKQAAEFYQLAVTASESPLASKLSDSDKVLVRLAASEVMVQSQNISQAISTLEPIFGSHSTSIDSVETAVQLDSDIPAIAFTQQQKKIAVWVLLRAGSASLSRGAYLNASTAYAIALTHADEEQRPLALLGDAWATAVRNERSADAVRKLANFVDQYPDHKDAPNAARGCAQCLKKLGRDADSTAMLSDLLSRWPLSLIHI